MAGDDTGDDLVIGETNHGQDSTELVGNVNDDGTYGGDYIFQAFVSPLIDHPTDALRGISINGGSGVVTQAVSASSGR